MVVESLQQKPVWGRAWRSYKPPHMRVYGTICISPEGRILLVKGAKTGIWSFPKGHLQRGELAQECALRELREETGLILPSQTYFKSFTLFAGEYFCYRIPELEPIPTDSTEICDAGWFYTNEMREMEINADIKCFLRERPLW